MNTIIQPKVGTSRPPAIAMTLGTLFALSFAGVVLIGSITPAAAGKGGKQAAAPAAFIPKPVIRDHRTQPVVRDHTGGKVVRDHTGGKKPTSKRRGDVPCLGNLC